MSGYQFIHMECYARKSGAGKAGSHTLASIVAEAERHDNACDHVANPKPPTLIFGVMPHEAAMQSEKWAECEKDTKGRKIRADGLCLLAGVISKDNSEKWSEYRNRSVNYLKSKYGDRLKSVVEHTDEAHPHIHFYVVPNRGERFDNIHDGRKAAAEAKKQKEAKGKQNAAYKNAMRAFQDDFYAKVAQYYGMTRTGPGRKRLTRDEWNKAQADAELIAKQRQELEILRRDLVEYREKLINGEKAQNAEWKRLKDMRSYNIRREQEIATMDNFKLLEQIQELQELKPENDALKSSIEELEQSLAAAIEVNSKMKRELAALKQTKPRVVSL